MYEWNKERSKARGRGLKTWLDDPDPYGTGHPRYRQPWWRTRCLRLSAVTLDGDDIYWLEGRPAEGGRNVLVRRKAGRHD